MASIAASPVYPDGLKKRSRLSDSYDYDLTQRKKRFRGGENGSAEETAAASTEPDVPKYTQRHVDYFEQMKQAEVARIRTEYEQYILKKEGEFQRCRQELQHTQERVHHQEKEAERLQGENRLLKRAIAIQSQQKDETQQENTALKSLASQAAEHIKRLEQANYTLRVHLQTSTAADRGCQQQPPDVF